MNNHENNESKLFCAVNSFKFAQEINKICKGWKTFVYFVRHFEANFQVSFHFLPATSCQQIHTKWIITKKKLKSRSSHDEWQRYLSFWWQFELTKFQQCLQTDFWKVWRGQTVDCKEDPSHMIQFFASQKRILNLIRFLFPPHRLKCHRIRTLR